MNAGFWATQLLTGLASAATLFIVAVGLSLVFGVTLLFLAIGELASMVQSGLLLRQRKDLEKRHPELELKGKPARLAHALSFVSGPGFSAALYALLGAAFLFGASLSG